MKPFRFRLERVLEWRKTRLTLEEARLEQLKSRRRALEEALQELAERERACGKAVAGAPAIAGSQFRALESFRRWAKREEQLLRDRISQAAAAVVAHEQVVMHARRDVRLLERLKENRHAAWIADGDREIEQVAGEYAIAQWRRNHQPLSVEDI